MLSTNDVPHKDVILSIPYLTSQEAQVASVKNTAPQRWRTSKANGAPHKDAIQGLTLTIQEEQVASVKTTKRRR